MSRLVKVSGERTLYQDSKSGMYYIRIYKDGRDTYRSLATTKKPEAISRIDSRRGAKVAARLGLALEPDADARQVTIAEVLKKYQEDGHPDRRGRKRKRLGSEPAFCKTLLDFFEEDGLVDHLTPKILDQYHAWRMKNVKLGEGHRITDLELNTLNNALRWAVRQEVIPFNPLSSRTRYYSSREARHCRELAPVDAKELHDFAGLLFKSKRSEVMGWQMLFEANTGLRSEEAVNLRMDARADEPGGRTSDGKSLYVRRCKDPRRDNPYAFVHPDLKKLIVAHKRWHSRRYPNSPWYFPGRDRSKLQHVFKGALTNALARLHKTEKLKRKITSHGMRAFYVLVRHSHGISDTQIAWEINHVGGVDTLETVYIHEAMISQMVNGHPHW